MHEETTQDSDEVHAQLLPQMGWVVHVQDLSCHQEHNAEGKIPSKKRR